MPRQWVVEVHRADPLTLTRIVPMRGEGRSRTSNLECGAPYIDPDVWDQTLMLVRNRQAQIDGREEHEHIRLDHGDTEVQTHED